ncbi:hypothetical protein BGZ61DRAFT_359378 [Ilyonectria robusta]|uniref:uncharacterized protein n=1 Tax=Ilyonectria robusta TaxID=1079257 RepID=UPI001E8D863C|nr:uncharacterized protein BGZ61DRAFT_359378 [Ilyonectria robusta]KAH8679190.1 hypothetical protein BGZ61DRAFT_359378 [Ilyonectria robusta]
MLGSATILRGFKISVAVLDAFLCANGVDETEGCPPMSQHHPDKDPISALLYTKVSEAGGTASKHKFRVMIPSREGHDHSTVAYVTYSWLTVYAHRDLQLDDEAFAEIPTGFQELRRQVLSYVDKVSQGRISDEGRLGLFAVHTHEYRGLYNPRELIDRFNATQYCDQCDAVFNDPQELNDWNKRAWNMRQDHRAEVHGSIEGRNPLPDV